MKKLIFAFLFAVAATVANAQTANAQFTFAYLSCDAALKAMPQYAEVQQSVAHLEAQYTEETKRVEEDFNQKYASFLEGLNDFAPAILKKRQSELQALLYSNLAFKAEADRLLKQAEADLYAPLKAKLNAVLAAICAEQGYAFILNTDGEALAVANPACGVDITAAVINALKGE